MMCFLWFGYASISFILTQIEEVKCKGIAVIGGAAGGGEVCLECSGNYTQEEMELALLIVGCILTIFFVILACQCYSRIMWECVEDKALFHTMKYMPPPAYNKRHCPA